MLTRGRPGGAQDYSGTATKDSGNHVFTYMFMHSRVLIETSCSIYFGGHIDNKTQRFLRVENVTDADLREQKSLDRSVTS